MTMPLRRPRVQTLLSMIKGSRKSHTASVTVFTSNSIVLARRDCPTHECCQKTSRKFIAVSRRLVSTQGCRNHGRHTKVNPHATPGHINPSVRIEVERISVTVAVLTWMSQQKSAQQEDAPAYVAGWEMSPSDLRAAVVMQNGSLHVCHWRACPLWHG